MLERTEPLFEPVVKRLLPRASSGARSPFRRIARVRRRTSPAKDTHHSRTPYKREKGKRLPRLTDTERLALLGLSLCGQAAALPFLFLLTLLQNRKLFDVGLRPLRTSRS